MVCWIFAWDCFSKKSRSMHCAFSMSARSVFAAVSPSSSRSRRRLRISYSRPVTPNGFDDDHPGDAIVRGKARRDDRADAVAQQIDARWIDLRILLQRAKRGGIAAHLGIEVNPAARRPLTIADAALLDAHRHESRAREVVRQPHVCKHIAVGSRRRSSNTNAADQQHRGRG